MTILATDQATEEVALAADRKPIEFGDYSTGERNSDGQTVRFGSKAAVDASGIGVRFAPTANMTRA